MPLECAPLSPASYETPRCGLRSALSPPTPVGLFASSVVAGVSNELETDAYADINGPTLQLMPNIGVTADSVLAGGSASAGSVARRSVTAKRVWSLRSAPVTETAELRAYSPRTYAPSPRTRSSWFTVCDPRSSVPGQVAGGLTARPAQLV